MQMRTPRLPVQRKRGSLRPRRPRPRGWGGSEKYAAALRFPLWLGHPVAVFVNERGVESSAQCDEDFMRQSSRFNTALGSARRGVRRNVAPRRRGGVIFRSVGPLSGGVVRGPRAGVGIRGAGSTTSGLDTLGYVTSLVRNPKAEQTQTKSRGWVDGWRIAPTEVSALPACICIWIGFSWAPIIRFWAPQDSVIAEQE
jgi:hypothetical protein